MSNSVLQDRHGPDWPLGFIKVATPGTPVGLMHYVDPNSYASPATATASTTPEYTQRFQQIMFQGIKPGATHGWQNNTGNVYIVRSGDGTGSANRDDQGALVVCVAPGQTIFLSASPAVNDVWGPYRYFVDADNANDGVVAVGLIF